MGDTATDTNGGERRTSIIAGTIRLVAAHPTQVEAIIADAARQHPQWANDIASAAMTDFPGHAPAIHRGLARARHGAGGAGGPATPCGPGAAGLHGTPGMASPTKAKPPAEPRSPWSGSVDLGGSQSTGNTEEASVNAAAELIFKDNPWQHRLRGRFDYGAEDNRTNENKTFAELKSRYGFNGRLYAYSIFDYESDRFAGYDYRLGQGAGLGYRVIDGKIVTWDLEAGPGARQTHFHDSDKTETEITGRGHSSFTWALSKSAELTNETTVTAGSERTVTENIIALSTTIIGNLAAKFSFEVSHDSEPVVGKEATDTVTRLSLSYRFGKS